VGRSRTGKFHGFRCCAAFSERGCRDANTLSKSVKQALSALTEAISRQSDLGLHIQHDITHIRLVPLHDLIPRLQVQVRRISSSQGKPIRFTVHGEMTEIDRDISETLAEPLSQLVRNAIMHGIEPPAERHAVGKPVEGSIAVNAYHIGSEVVIEVGDDGRRSKPASTDCQCRCCRIA